MSKGKYRWLVELRSGTKKTGEIVVTADAAEISEAGHLVFKNIFDDGNEYVAHIQAMSTFSGVMILSAIDGSFTQIEVLPYGQS